MVGMPENLREWMLTKARELRTPADIEAALSTAATVGEHAPENRRLVSSFTARIAEAWDNSAELAKCAADIDQLLPIIQQRDPFTWHYSAMLLATAHALSWRIVRLTCPILPDGVWDARSALAWADARLDQVLAGARQHLSAFVLLSASPDKLREAVGAEVAAAVTQLAGCIASLVALRDVMGGMIDTAEEIGLGGPPPAV